MFLSMTFCTCGMSVLEQGMGGVVKFLQEEQMTVAEEKVKCVLEWGWGGIQQELRPSVTDLRKKVTQRITPE